MTTLLQQLASVSSQSYLDVERTLNRARSMLNRDGLPARAYRALAVRCAAHADQCRADHLGPRKAILPGGSTEILTGWDSDLSRLTWRLLRTYEEQALRLAHPRA
jgi:hypothetical protein